MKYVVSLLTPNMILNWWLQSILFVVCKAIEASNKPQVYIYLDTIIDIILGDVADDRFFHKTNDSDATQFALLYPRIGAHGAYLRSIFYLYQQTYFLVWATFWIIFQLASLAGFAVLGIFAFKV